MAAIVGGAVEGAGVKVPVITGTGRQVAAGLVGLLMLVVGLTSRWMPVAHGVVGMIRGRSERRVARRVQRPDVGVAPMASEHFIGREAELRWLRKELFRSRRVVLSGLGGVGKTQLALQYLRRHRASYRQGAFWLRGEDAAMFDGDLASMTEFLGLPQRAQPDLEVVMVVRWLTRHHRWLLVIDNLDGETVERVEERLPPELPGHVLITSRHPLPGSRRALEALPVEAATEFLLRRTRQPDAAVAVDARGTLFVADSANRRVLRFERPRTNFQAADLVLGQPNFTTVSLAGCNVGLDATTLCGAIDVAIDRRGPLYALDAQIGRVLRYDHPRTNGQAADLVLGQADFNSSSLHCSFHGGVSATGLCFPHSMALDRQGNLYVADTANARVLRFSRPDSSGRAADLVLGQADFTTGTQCGFFTVRMVSARSLCAPEGVAVDRQGDVLVSDVLDNRLLRFNGSGREEDDEGSEG